MMVSCALKQLEAATEDAHANPPKASRLSFPHSSAINTPFSSIQLIITGPLRCLRISKQSTRSDVRAPGM